MTTSGVEPEEVQAILDLFGGRENRRAPEEVAERDFRRPRRLSPPRLEALRRALHASMPELAGALAAIFGRAQRVELSDVSEVSAEGLLDAVGVSLARAELDVAGQPAWILWPAESAISAVEGILGSTPKPKATSATSEPAARALSRVEARLLARIFTAVSGAVCRALGAKAGEVRVLGASDDARGWREAGDAADDHRLAVNVELWSGETSSHFQVYVPGVALDAKRSAEPKAPHLPDHLGPVTVEVCARLGASDVSLAELLALQPGDVIPLGTPVETPLSLVVEEHTCATAKLGTVNGRLAVRVQTVHPPDDSSSEPTA